MDSIFDYYNTILPINMEAGYQINKSLSPFNRDSGSDYDLRGYYNKYGSLVPTASNLHLTDEFKKPNHPTFSNQSMYYTRQPYAVNWNKYPYNYLSQMGII